MAIPRSRVPHLTWNKYASYTPKHHHFRGTTPSISKLAIIATNAVCGPIAWSVETVASENTDGSYRLFSFEIDYNPGRHITVLEPIENLVDR